MLHITDSSSAWNSFHDGCRYHTFNPPWSSIPQQKTWLSKMVLFAAHQLRTSACLTTDAKPDHQSACPCQHLARQLVHQPHPSGCPPFGLSLKCPLSSRGVWSWLALSLLFRAIGLFSQPSCSASTHLFFFLVDQSNLLLLKDILIYFISNETRTNVKSLHFRNWNWQMFNILFSTNDKD